MINTEDEDFALLMAGHITREQFEANQRVRERMADTAAQAAALLTLAMGARK